MKKMMMTLAAVLCCAMTTTLFTACGDDDDDNGGGNSTKNNAVRIYYEFTLGQSFIDFYDVYAIFTNIDGDVVRVPITNTKNYYDKTVAYDKAPNEYEFSVIGIPKAEHPAIDPLGSYDVSISYNINVGVLTSENSYNILREIIGKTKTINSHSQGSRVEERLAQGERTIIEKMTGKK